MKRFLKTKNCSACAPGYYRLILELVTCVCLLALSSIDQFAGDAVSMRIGVVTDGGEETVVGTGLETRGSLFAVRRIHHGPERARAKPGWSCSHHTARLVLRPRREPVRYTRGSMSFAHGHKLAVARELSNFTWERR